MKRDNVDGSTRRRPGSGLYCSHYLYYSHCLVFLAFCVLLAWGLFRAEPVPMPFQQADKLAHFSVFFVFSLGLSVLSQQYRRPLFWCLLIVLAALAEPAQAYWRPLRVFSYGDMLANISGALVAVVILVFLKPLSADTLSVPADS